MRTTPYEWQQAIRKVMAVPGAEILLAVAVVLLATWFLVQDDIALKGASAPLYWHH